ncbi:MAG: histidine ammonia-lyase [Flavobacteriales bacterium]|nr:histidine ammonia-lyase [Flavobacteriales bacterium]
MQHTISAEHLTLEKVDEIIRSRVELTLSDDSRRRIIKCRDYLDERIARSDDPIYGINTGFGSLCNTKIDKASRGQLQKNLVMSHAAGTGKEVRPELVKLMLLLKIQGLSYGHSGVTLELVERLIWHYNNDVLPVVYDQGSLGASGDLAPLAHLALPLLGKGEVWQNGKKAEATNVLEEHGLEPLTLRSKEGLAMLNGTQFMSAHGVLICLEAKRQLDAADLIGSCSLEAFDGRPEPFNDEVHVVRVQPGQRTVARHIREILADSQNFHASKAHVQDPYSFRCIPQVHGAARDAVDHCLKVFENEINAVTDNPTIFPDSDEIISAGNFHGQPLALALDFMAIAMAEIGSISERRTYKLVNGKRGLPDFLVADPGLNSGFMIPQYTAASIVSRNKQLCTPASVDTIDSSNGQEDHVSMGANAAVKCLEVVENVQSVLAIELLTSCQALHFRNVEGAATKIQRLYSDFRKTVPAVEQDREMYPLIAASKAFLKTVQL